MASWDEYVSWSSTLETEYSCYWRNTTRWKKVEKRIAYLMRSGSSWISSSSTSKTNREFHSGSSDRLKTCVLSWWFAPNLTFHEKIFLLMNSDNFLALISLLQRMHRSCRSFDPLLASFARILSLFLFFQAYLQHFEHLIWSLLNPTLFRL